MSKITSPKPRVLVADESISIQKLAHLAFVDFDFEVISASDGNDAFNKIKKMKPIMVVAASELTDIDGIRLCEMVKKDPELKATAVLILKGPMASESRLAKARPDGILIKPFDAKHLIKAVREILDSFDEESTVVKEPPEKTLTLQIPATEVGEDEPTRRMNPKDKLEAIAAEVTQERAFETFEVSPESEVKIEMPEITATTAPRANVKPAIVPVSSPAASPAPAPKVIEPQALQLSEADLKLMAEGIIKEWVDKNISGLMERLVKEEVARILQSH